MKIDLYTAFEALIMCFGLLVFTMIIGLLFRRSLGILGQMSEVIIGVISGELHYDPQVAEARKQGDPQQSKWSVNELIHLKNGLILLQMLSDDGEPIEDEEDGLESDCDSENDQ